MNWAQFKHPVSHMCLAGIVVASQSFTQEVACSGCMFAEFSYKYLGKTPFKLKPLPCQIACFQLQIIISLLAFTEGQTSRCEANYQLHVETFEYLCVFTILTLFHNI